MADYHEITSPASGGGVGTPMLGVRKDKPAIGGRTSADNQYAMPLLDAADVLRVNSQGNIPTYSACITGLVPAASCTNLLELVGSATKTVKLRRVRLSGFAGTAISVPVSLNYQSAADTGGTATQPTVVPNDPGDAAGTAVLNAYTANPTVGTTVGALAQGSLHLPATTGSGEVLDFTWDRPGVKCPTIRGVAQCLSVNLNGTSVSSGKVEAYVEWTEEPTTC